MEKKSEDQLKELDLTNYELDFVLPYMLIDHIPKNLDLVMDIVERKLKVRWALHDSWAYLVNKVGAARFEEAMEVVDKWFNEPNLKTKISNIIPELCRNIDKIRLLPFLENWAKQDEVRLDTAMDSLSMVMFKVILDIGRKIPASDILKQAESKESEFLRRSLHLLEGIAKHKDLDVSFFIGGEENKIFQCASVIEAIKYYRDSLDYDQIRQAASIYHNIESFMGKSWFMKMKDERNKTNVVLRLMSFNDKNFLSNFNITLGNILSEKLPGTKQLRMNLQSKALRQDYATLSEIGFLSHFLRKSKIELYPSVGVKKLDFKIWISESPILFEVKNLAMYRYLKALEGTFITLPDTVKRKICTEYDEQLMSLDIDLPLLMAIDLRDSEAGIDEVGASTRYFEGKMKNLTGVVLFRNPLYHSSKSKTEGMIITNDFAINPLSPSTLEKLKQVLFA
ncbi:hypothetical protein [Candidatus Nitrososphaera evergladensis]|uniref:hypothetical protein n=1 Tax=Candidatus Nitrososphaera evergladensis TaxID=1459637 RepID=UPI0011E59D1C|nr:hypothetical protein [Candidatus Nitrososphaera evergladensis]